MEPRTGEEEEGINKGGPEDKFQNEVIVKGLPYASTEKEIEDFFNKFGKIASINLLKHPDGRSKGTAFVRMSTEEGVVEAEKASGSDFGGRNIFVEKTKPKDEKNFNRGGYRGGYNNNRGGYGYNRGGNYGGGNSRGGYNGGDYKPREHTNQESTLFVGNLSWGTNPNMIRDFFGP